MPSDYARFLSAFRANFSSVENGIERYTEEIVECEFDLEMMNIIIFSLYVDQDANAILSLPIDRYVHCFMDREHIIEEQEPIIDEEGNEIDVPPIEYFEVTVLSNQTEVYRRISALTGIEVTEKQSVINEVYRFLHDVGEAEDAGTLTVLLQEAFEISEQTTYVGGEFGSPFADGWKQKVSSEFGSRTPIKLPDGVITEDFHNGIDLAASQGTDVLSVQDGTVVLVRSFNVGLGNYCVIDHGGGIFTVYGHNSKVTVTEGQHVSKGQKVAEVGMSGYATGNHLHLEVIVARKCINPRRYLT
jgi:murein DD-endopeptidase MepM/ murein hydrolase activator NlpD